MKAGESCVFCKQTMHEYDHARAKVQCRDVLISQKPLQRDLADAALSLVFRVARGHGGCRFVGWLEGFPEPLHL